MDVLTRETKKQKYPRTRYFSSGKKYIVRIGRELETLTDEDIDFIMQSTTTLAEAERRLYTANRR